MSPPVAADGGGGYVDPLMLSIADLAHHNLERARDLRTGGASYREIRRALAISAAQLGHIRRALKREKGARTRLSKAMPDATDRDLPIMGTSLPAGLRRTLIAAGHRTLGDLADRLADPDLPGLAAIAGIGPHRARLVEAVLDRAGLRAGSSDLQAEIERLFPELGEG